MREYQSNGEGKGMCTARPGWQTISPQNMNYETKMYPIKVNLVDVLEIDTARRTVRCEPLVSMGQLTSTLDSLGWTIPIVPELVMKHLSVVTEIFHPCNLIEGRYDQYLSLQITSRSFKFLIRLFMIA